MKTSFFLGDRLKNFCEDLFFLESTFACVLGPWSLVLGLGLGLGLEHYSKNWVSSKNKFKNNLLNRY